MSNIRRSPHPPRLPTTHLRIPIAALFVVLGFASTLGACNTSTSTGVSGDTGADAALDTEQTSNTAQDVSPDTTAFDAAQDTNEPDGDTSLADVPEDTLADTPEDTTPEDTNLEDAPTDTANADVPQDTLTDAPEGDTTPGDVSADTPEDIADVPEDTRDIADTDPPDVAPDADANIADIESFEAFDIRIMAANTTSGNFQSYDLGHGVRIFQAFEPDITLIQEFDYGDNDSDDIRDFVDLAFGEEFYYYREPGAEIPNGVISRWPIEEAGIWEDDEAPNREFAWARIDIPGPIDLWAVSVHLLTRSAPVRNTEATQLVGYIEANIPAGDLLVVGGDLNTDTSSESALTTLRQIVSFRHTPVDNNGNPNTNQRRAKPYDWVLPDTDLEAYHTPLVIGDQSFPNGLVFDSTVYTPLADVAPVQFGDSEAPSMQHMAVIKQFRVSGSP